MLPAVPDQLLDEHGAPRFGAWAGMLDAIDWTSLQTPRRPGWLDRNLRHKRWQYLALAHPEVFVGLAVVDLGWAAHAFAYAFLRGPRQLVSVARDGVPGMSRVSRPFADARARLPGLRLEMRRAGSELAVTLDSRALSLAAELDLATMPPPACVVAPANLLAHCTHKSTAIAASGWLVADGKRIALDSCHASLDHSDGLLAHDTRWNWASAHGDGVGFNLQAGYMGDAENIVWLAGRPYKLGAVQFDYRSADPLAPWHVRSACGSTDLRFVPEGMHRGNKNLGIVASRFVQAIGCFSGRLGVPGHAGVAVCDLLGVTEEHASRW